METLTKKEMDGIIRKYYKDKVKEDRAKAKEKEKEKEKELEKDKVSEEEEIYFKGEILKIGEEISKLCYTGVKEANYLINIHQDSFLLLQEGIKEKLYEIIYFFNTLLKTEE